MNPADRAASDARVPPATGPIDENLVRVTVDAALSAIAQAPE